jgi:putative transcriptional regulator
VAYVPYVMDDPPYLTGQFLLAMPGIGDPRFEHAVIAMCNHDDSGALGIGLGTVIDALRFHDVLKQLDIDPAGCADAPVHLGGPVEPRRGFVLHSRDWDGGDTIDIAGRWRLSGTLDVLRAIAGGAGPRQWVCALGYAGWGEGQLDEELTRHGWLSVAGDDALLFDTPADARWSAGLAGAGIDPRLLAATTGHA